MGIEPDITWLDSIDDLEHWSAPAQYNSKYAIMKIPFAAYCFSNYRKRFLVRTAIEVYNCIFDVCEYENSMTISPTLLYYRSTLYDNNVYN